MKTDEKIVVKTRHGELTLEQLAEVQPGIARLMKEIGERFSILYYAAKAGCWRLAQHELNVVMSLLKTGSTLRPKYSKDFASFTDSSLHPIGESIKAKDWNRFENAFSRAVEETNRFHEKYEYGFIRYVVSKKSPENLDLSVPD
jgi:hypothetical protein